MPSRHLTEAEVRDFQRLIKQERGVELTMDEAAALAEQLMLLRIVADVTRNFPKS